MEGEFPESELICEEPILVVSFKIGLCRVDPKGKECRTIFQRLSFNGETSVVRCLPVTGRTHQIRVHLQYLGFPILNDPIYGSSAWGPNRGKGGLVGKSNEELLQALVEEHCSQESLHLLEATGDCIDIVKKADKDHISSEPSKSGESHTQTHECGGDTERDAQKMTVGRSETVNEVNQGCADTNSKDTNASVHESQSTVQGRSDGNQPVCSQKKPPGTRDNLCSECKIVRPDPTEKDLIMYLHALRYKGPDFEYSTLLPDWAKDDWAEGD